MPARKGSLLNPLNAVQWLVATRSRRRAILRIAVVLVLFPLVLQWVLAYLIGGDARLLPPELLHAKSLLIVTAHPDDECLFFSPAILGVLDRNKDIKGSLIVMSTGNNYGLGEKRKEELKGSCVALGVDPSRCEALDDPDLQDNPTLWWDTAKIQKIVKDHVKKWDVDAILTFDEGGISGHINHRAVSAAITEYVSQDPKAPAAYTLTTTAVLRKYSILFDLPLTALSFTWRIAAAIFFPSDRAEPQYSTRALLANTWHRYMLTRKAFASHGSQYTWDRHLYMILSRYVYFNDLKRIEFRGATE